MISDLNIIRLGKSSFLPLFFYGSSGFGSRFFMGNGQGFEIILHNLTIGVFCARVRNIGSFFKRKDLKNGF